MELETVGIELGGGATATLFREVLWRTARLQEAELRKHMTLVDTAENNTKILLSELEKALTAPKPDYVVDLGSLEPDVINEIYILNQVVSWTFGPVDKATLYGKVTRDQYKTLVKEMDRLYKPIPLQSDS